MPEEMAARYAQYSDVELFELARGGEGSLRPEAWQSLINELRNRGLELEPEDEGLESGRPNASITIDSASPVREVLQAEVDLARRQQKVAALYIVIGFVVTFGTYAIAAASGGRAYLIAWGAILYGIIRAVRASARRTRAEALLQTASDVVRK